MKAAIYCRLSEEDRDKRNENDESGSIQNQKSMLIQYAKQQGWEVYNVYSDDDYAGADRNRPEFNRLLKDAERGEFDIVLCKTQSRFTRELELVEKYIHGLFPAWGVRFISIVDNADTANRGNKKSRQINGLVNEWYLEDMSENIRSVLTNRRVNGYHIGSFALYGYKKDPEGKGRLIVDESAAAVVREVFELFAGGRGKTAIARMLNERGVPNPTEYKRQCGLRYRGAKTKTGTLWKYSAISSMLTNEIYTGSMVQGKYGSVSYKTKQNKPRPKSEWYVVPNTHEAIIDSELWARVQAIIERRAKPLAAGETGIFAGKVRCAECGCALRSSKSRGKYYLQCSTRHVSKSACGGAFIAVEKLKELVWGELSRLTERYVDKEELAEKIEPCRDLSRQAERAAADIAELEKRLAEYSGALRELYMDKARRVISEEDYRELSRELSAERGRLTLAAENGRARLMELEKELSVGDRRGELVSEYLGVNSPCRAAVETMVDYIAVSRRIAGTRDVPIEIHWNF